MLLRVSQRVVGHQCGHMGQLGRLRAEEFAAGGGGVEQTLDDGPRAGQDLAALAPFEQVFMISAATGDGIEVLLDYCAAKLPDLKPCSRLKPRWPRLKKQGAIITRHSIQNFRSQP